MYVFYGSPLQIVTSKESGKPLFRFDTKGEYYSNDFLIYERAIGHYDHAEIEISSVGERVARTVLPTPPLTITVAGESPVEAPVDAPTATEQKQEINGEQTFPCKYCHQSFETYGLRQKHYLAICPKRG